MREESNLLFRATRAPLQSLNIWHRGPLLQEISDRCESSIIAERVEPFGTGHIANVYSTLRNTDLLCRFLRDLYKRRDRNDDFGSSCAQVVC